MKLCQNVCPQCLSWTSLKHGHVRSKSKSLDQILEKNVFTQYKSKSFILIYMKLFQNVYLYEI